MATTTTTTTNYNKCWAHLIDTLDLETLQKLYNTKHIYPEFKNIFNVFSMDVKDIRIVLLGQDPYHGKGQAHGYSFSVPSDEKIPPSLRNIFKELNLEFPERNYKFTTGNIEKWFNEEKIFLLNAALTVEEASPGSHMVLWNEFTDNVIKYIAEHNDSCIFLFMGNFAKDKINILNKLKKPELLKRIVTCVHPSPLSASRGFFNCGVFKNIENLLGHEINWQN